MSKAKFKLNMKGLHELRKSAEMQKIIDDKVSQVLNITGDGYSTNPHFSEERYIVTVYPEEFKAKSDNWKNNTLEKAVRAVKE
mgnify:CR=1 FL=1